MNPIYPAGDLRRLAEAGGLVSVRRAPGVEARGVNVGAVGAILKDSHKTGAAIIGGALSFLYIIYALLCIPAQGFNTISAMVSVTQNLTGAEIAEGSALIWGFFLLLMGLTAFSVFGGLRRS